MGGGNLAVMQNVTLPAAVNFCLNASKCAGFTAEWAAETPKGGCNGTLLSQVFFKVGRKRAPHSPPQGRNIVLEFGVFEDMRRIYADVRCVRFVTSYIPRKKQTKNDDAQGSLWCRKAV